MKLRWWVIGAIAVTVGGLFVMKHFGDGKKQVFKFADRDNEKNLCEVSSENSELGFEEVDFFG